MDKIEFIKEAPLYYALAIASELNKQGDARTMSEYAIQKVYNVPDDTEHDGYTALLGRAAVWDAAIAWLKKEGMMSVSKASFGPPLYSQSDAFAERWEELKQQSPFHHFDLVDEKSDWLISALWEVENVYVNLKITSDDFVDPLDVWQPVEVDRDDPELKVAIEKLSSAMEEIRKDNGYAATHPQERNYVLGGLSEAVKNLETGSVVPGYLRDAWAKLVLLGRRVRGGSLELVVTGAKQAIIEFVKQKGGALLRAMIDLISWPWP